MGTGRIDSRIIDLDTSWRIVVRFTPGKRVPGIHRIGGRVGPRTGLNDVEKRKISPLPGLEL
jgi:hypothetical protein